MKLYRFSPIQDEKALLEAITYIHFECFKLCNQLLGHHLPVIGNLGVFCHYDKEYDSLVEIRKELAWEENNIDHKYYRLHEPIVIGSKDNTPKTIYTHLYIRKPDPYRHHVGDIDFYLDLEKYQKLKNLVLADKKTSGIRVFERKDLDMIELYDPDSDVLAYIRSNKII